MSWVPNQVRNDDAAGVVLHALAIFVLYPIAIASFVLAALIDPPAGAQDRMRRAFGQPIVALSLAMLAWAGVSVLWTPFSIPAGQHLLKMALWLVTLIFVLTTTRGHARATEVYLFPFGLLLGMIAMFAAFVANRYGADVPQQRIF